MVCAKNNKQIPRLPLVMLRVIIVISFVKRCGTRTRAHTPTHTYTQLQRNEQTSIYNIYMYICIYKYTYLSVGVVALYTVFVCVWHLL